MAISTYMHGSLEHFECLDNPDAALRFAIAPATFGGSTGSNDVVIFLDDTALARRIGRAIETAIKDRREELACAGCQPNPIDQLAQAAE